jgi:NAD(P)-dependent dehydrogenase (short-subunit alcohol dehydrogenase family)
MESLDFYSRQSNNCFKEKNILVTGGTGDIGKKVVDSLIKLGARVVVISRSEKKIFESLKDFVRKESFGFEIMNFEDPLTINKGFVSIMKKFKGKLDSVIMCHGIFKVGKLVETNIDQFDTALNINVRSCCHLLSIATPFLKLSNGNVVILSSLESKILSNDSFLNSLSKVRLLK